MRTRSILLSLLLTGALACGQNQKKDPKKDPLLTKPPTNNTQPVKTSETKPDTAPATSTSAPSTPSSSVVTTLPDLSTYLSKGTEIESTKPFSYNFEVGKSATYQISVRWKLKGLSNIKGLSLPIGDFSGAFVADLTWTPKEVDDKGIATIELTYGRIQAEFDTLLYGGLNKIDSRSKEQNVPNTLLIPFTKMDGKTFTMKISKDGKISELTGQDTILTEALSDPAFPAELKTQIIASIGEQGLKQILGQGFLAFPKPELKKAETFRVTANPLTVPGLGQINVQEDVMLEGLREIDGKKLGLFSLKLFAIFDSTGAGGTAVAVLPGLKIAGTATATEGTGFFIFDTERGLPSSAALPVPLDLQISVLNDDGTPKIAEPINVTGDVALSAQLIE